jgi:DNA repair exonuclease SbcCD ATPase subunit
MNDIAQASFDYGIVDQESADRLREIKQEIHDITGNAGVQIGMRLVEAQKLFNRRGKSGREGGFLDWVEKEARVQQAHAYKLINLYKKFGEENDLSLMINHFSETALISLAAPSTPDSVIEKAREVAESGGTLTVAQVEEMKRKAKEEARAEMEAEKAALQSKLALVEQRTEDWREQAKTEKKKREEAETAARLKAEELKTLNQSIEQTAKRMAAAQLAEIQAQLEHAKIDKLEAEKTIQDLKKGMDAAAETKAKRIVQAQQDEINRREAQLRTIEGRIDTLNQRLVKVDQQDTVVAHFEQVTREIRATLNTLGHQIQVAIDEEEAPFLPSPFVPTFEKLAEQLEHGAAGVRAFLANVDVRQLEVLTNE